MSQPKTPVKKAKFEPTEYQVGWKVWFPDDNRGWVSGSVTRSEQNSLSVRGSDNLLYLIQPKHNGLTVRVDESRKSSSFEIFELLLQNATVEQTNTDNLVDLVDLHEASVLNCVKERFEGDEIYTNVGSILLAVNPYKKIEGVYSPERHRIYREKFNEKLPPHVFYIAEGAFRNILPNAVSNGQSQAIIVSGESGAGKTESCKYILAHIGQSSGGGKMSDLSNMVVKSGDLLEAFGNAKTTLNDNSSRFGKFMKVRFNHAREVAGVEINTYLLEKSRVTKRCTGDRSFHIFYQLCAAPKSLRNQLHLENAESYSFLANSGVFTVDDVDDAAAFATTLDAMTSMSISAADQNDIWKIIAAILHLGNVQFVQSRDGYASISSDICLSGYSAEQEIGFASKLLGINEDNLVSSLTTSYIEVEREQKTKRLTMNEAHESRDAICKFLYASVFDWIVVKINSRLVPPKATIIPTFIGLLDIFGFETFENNSLEQLFINYTNETIQSIFNRHIFTEVKREYEEEGIKWIDVDFTDNKKIIDVIESTRNGIFSELDNAIRLKQLSNEKSDADFMNKMEREHKSSDIFKRINGEPTKFSIEHFAGKVVYNSSGFCDKNSDTVQKTLRECILSSSMGFLKKIIPASWSSESSRVSQLSGITLCASFKDQLLSLKEDILMCQTHFVRCIKPNKDKRPDDFKGSEVLRQLKYSGVIEAIRIMRQFYAIRFLHKSFIERFFGDDSYDWRHCLFKILRFPAMFPYNEKFVNIAKLGHSEIIRSLIRCLNLKEIDDYQVGKTKIFIHSAAAKEISSILEKHKLALAKEISEKLTKSLSQIKQASALTLRRCVTAVVYKKQLDPDIPDPILIPDIYKFERLVRRFLFRFRITFRIKVKKVNKIRKAYRRYRARKMLSVISERFTKVTIDRAEFKKMQWEAKDQRDTNDDLRRQLSTAKVTIEKFHSEVGDLRKEISEAKAGHEKVANENDRLKTQIQSIGADQQTIVIKYDEILKTKDAEIEMLKKEIEHLRNDNSGYIDINAALEVEVASLTRENDKVVQLNQQVAEDRDRNYQDFLNCGTLLLIAEDAQRKLEGEVGQLKVDLEVLSKKNKTLQAETARLQQSGGGTSGPSGRRQTEFTSSISQQPSVSALSSEIRVNDFFPLNRAVNIHKNSSVMVQLVRSVIFRCGAKHEGYLFYKEKGLTGWRWSQLSFAELYADGITICRGESDRTPLRFISIYPGKLHIGLSGNPQLPQGSGGANSAFLIDKNEQPYQFVATKSDHMSEWAKKINSNIALAEYVESCFLEMKEPDIRIIKLLENRRITAIDLTGYEITSHAINFLQHIAIDYLEYVNSINFTNTLANDDTTTRIARLLHSIREVKTINFNENDWTDETLKNFVENLPARNQLTHIRLKSNCLTDASAETITKLFAKCPNLVEVDLSFNKLGLKAVKALCGGISSLPFRYVRLNGNQGIGIDSTRAIIELCKSNHSIKHLRLGDCGLTDDDISPLLEFLRSTDALVETIDLSRNAITQEVLATATQIFKENNYLKSVNFGNVFVDGWTSFAQNTSGTLEAFRLSKEGYVFV